MGYNANTCPTKMLSGNGISGTVPSPSVPDPECSDGIKGSGGKACCPKSCGACGGAGCSNRPGGASSCCGGDVANSGISCDVSSAPCAITQIPSAGDPKCENGILSVSGKACCAKNCGACGGGGCSNRPGGSSKCCGGPVTKSGISCDNHHAPCAMTTVAVVGDPTCRNGILSPNKKACC